MASKRIRIGLVLASTVIATACAPSATELPADEAQAYAETIDPIVEDTLIGLSEGNYELHAKHFNEELEERVDPIVVFPQVYEEIIGTVGAYESHQLVKVVDQNRLRIATFSVTFANDPDVRASFVFFRNDPEKKLTGLWFDSEQLTRSGGY